MSKVYVVVNTAAVDFEEVNEVWGVFTDLETAKKVMMDKWQETTDQIFATFHNGEYEVETDSDGLGICAYEDGSYVAFHNTARIYESSIK